MLRSHNQGNELAVPPLLSGGVMLSYHCTNTCRHCLYRCSPKQPDEWMSPETAERVFATLAKESHLQGIHIAGGEPMLKPDLALEVVRIARRLGVPLDYMETNAFWCADREDTRDKFTQLKAAGLPAVLISVSMFHNEFISFRRTRLCVEIAHEVFGPHRTLVYMPHIFQLLAELPDDGTHSLEEFARLTGLEDRWEEIPSLYSVIPAGRAPEALRECYSLLPAESFRNETCRHELLNTTHFHIDHLGNLFTGLCAGLVAAQIDNLHPAISSDTHPVFCKLCDEGPYGLFLLAKENFEYSEKEGGYVSKCDLCFDTRRHLQANGESHELKPDAYYLT